jgi:hypothetical protein
MLRSHKLAVHGTMLFEYAILVQVSTVRAAY